MVSSAEGPAVAIDRNNLVIAVNRPFCYLIKQETGGILGEPLVDLVDARDVFGNQLSSGTEGLHRMVQKFDRVRDFQIHITTGEHERLLVGISVVIVLQPNGRDYHLILLVTPIESGQQFAKPLQNVPVREGNGKDKNDHSQDSRGIGEIYPLTSRHRAVLRLLSQGKTTADISAELELSVHTVRSHIQKVFRVLDVKSQLEAVVKAQSLKIL